MIVQGLVWCFLECPFGYADLAVYLQVFYSSLQSGFMLHLEVSIEFINGGATIYVRGRNIASGALNNSLKI